MDSSTGTYQLFTESESTFEENFPIVACISFLSSLNFVIFNNILCRAKTVYAD